MKNFVWAVMFSAMTITVQAGVSDIGSASVEVDQAIQLLENIERDSGVRLGASRQDFDKAMRLLLRANRTLNNEMNSIDTANNREELIEKARTIQKLIVEMISSDNELKSRVNAQVSVNVTKAFGDLNRKLSFLRVSGDVIIISSESPKETERYFVELCGELVATLMQIKNIRNDPRTKRIFDWGYTTLVHIKGSMPRTVIENDEAHILYNLK